MSYQVIARKYRPQRFSDVVGQEHVTQTLANAITQNRIAHAYLFCGPRGTGKTTIARIFAKCLNCSGGPKVDFEESDPRCAEIAEGRSLDVLEIDGASNNGVEQVRELRETVKYAPAASKFKIYIIDEVHMLSTAAFNALLKTLEEPPAHVKFMFATTDPERVLPTILSRCQRFDLRRIPVTLIVQHLTQIARQERVTIEPAALHAIARGADGGMRDAECALDQLISFCGDRIVENDVLSMFGLTAQGRILALAQAVLRADAAAVLEEVNDLAKHGKDLGRLISDLLHYFRNLLLYQVSGGDPKLLEVSEAEATSLAEHAPHTSVDATTRIMEVLTEAEGKLRDASSKKIFVEVALLKAIQARNTLSLDTVLKQLQQLRQGGGSGNLDRPSAATRSPESARAAPTPPATMPRARAATTESHPGAPAPAVAATAATAHDLPQLWSNLLEAVGRVSAFVKSYLVQAFAVSFEKGIFTIGFDPEFADQMDLVNVPKNQAILQTKLQELGYPGIQIRFVACERPTGMTVTPGPEPMEASPPPADSLPRPGPTPAAAGHPGPSRAGHAKTSPAQPPAPSGTERVGEFKNDPLIQKALEIFKGHIVEVRA